MSRAFTIPGPQPTTRKPSSSFPPGKAASDTGEWKEMIRPLHDEPAAHDLPQAAVMTASVRRSLVSLALLGCCAIGSTPHAADAYPTRPIRWVVATAPGGGVDAIARILAPRLGEQMGQTVIVENRPGAGGNVGVEIVARSNPDGQTLLASTSTVLTVNPSLYKMPVSIEKDLQPITVLAAAEQAVVVHPSVPAKSLKELIALAREKPGALNYASAGTGTALHLGAELLKLRTGIDMTHVPYKGGGPAAAATLSGEAQVIVGTVASTIAFIQAGRLRPIASTGAKRSRLLPDVPTVAESGYPGFEASVWFAMLGPSGTPKDIVQRLYTETLKALKQADVQTAMSRQGMEAQPNTPAALAARIRNETATWATVIKKTGIRLD
jgi:tripartite-type tricarboxylate transporter receptor subunit TctC